MLDSFLRSLPIWLLEVAAAAAGSFYLKKSINPTLEIKTLVGFLWLSFLIDLSGFYTSYAYYNSYESLSFIKDTPFERNFWLFNIRKILEYLVFVVFFLAQLRASRFKKFVQPLVLAIVPVLVLNLVFSDVFFIAYSQLATLVSTFVYLLLIFRFFYEVLQSDKILHFYKSLPFYIAIGLMLWYLCITPLFLYSKYYKAVNVEYVEIQRLVLLVMNFCMYGCFIAGFIICALKNKRHNQF